jgi:hypothetical protein
MAVVRIDCDRIVDRESFHAVFAEAFRACLGKPDPRAFDAAWIKIPIAYQLWEQRALCTAGGLEDGSADHQKRQKAMAVTGQAGPLARRRSRQRVDRRAGRC